MKKKLIAIGIIFSLILAGCSKQDEQSTTTETTTNTTTSTTQQEEPEEVQKNKTDISIFTKDEEIEYSKISDRDENFDNNDEKVKMVLDFINKRAEDELIQLENDENIRIEFPHELPKDSKVNIIKTYVKQNGKGGTENVDESMVVELNKNGNVDFKHTFDTNDKYLDLVIYEVLISWDDILVKYNFAIKVDNRSTPNNKPYAVTGYLSSDQQKIYDNYKKDKNIDVFKGIEPTTMVKYYTQAIMEQEYNIAYTLYKGEDEENYMKIIKSFDEDLKEDYISNLKAAANGKFVEETKEKGYIEYELQKNHSMAIDVTKDNDIWKIQYIPIQ